METKKRSFAKSITWRMLGIVVLGAIAWFVTEDWQITTAVTVLFHAIQVILYYFHERLWDRNDWGFKNKNELTDKEKEKIKERLRKLGYIE